MAVKVRRAYESPHPDDGFRILVDRLWPRGISKDTAKIGLWLKEIAPSAELRKWFGHEPEKWPEFRSRYFAELKQRAEELTQLKAQIRKGPVTLVFAAKDEAHNNAVALREYLKR